MADPITLLPDPPTRANPSDFAEKGDAFLGALPDFAVELNAVATAFNLDDTSSTSVTSVTVGSGSKSFTVDVDKSYLPGMTIKIAQTSDNDNWMHGSVDTYDSSTGALVVDVTYYQGSGTITDWTITFSAPITNGLAVTRSTMTGDETFTDNDLGRLLLFMDTNGASRNINPTGTITDGFEVVAVNKGNIYNLIFDSTGIDGVITPGSRATFYYDETNDVWV